ncbi:hypothetical protein GLOIN_2v1792160 [Rhizophagus clarus]|uniref:Uncharacterized protein n=1 Tax=Rhizophagus clarus TaxID=94130 RepID=A0A8H3M7H6_9GLOM|nr:hypothetical protein GLOIN_2v1792160 [Rhizophagus clarus]
MTKRKSGYSKNSSSTLATNVPTRMTRKSNQKNQKQQENTIALENSRSSLVTNIPEKTMRKSNQKKDDPTSTTNIPAKTTQKLNKKNRKQENDTIDVENPTSTPTPKKLLKTTLKVKEQEAQQWEGSNNIETVSPAPAQESSEDSLSNDSEGQWESSEYVSSDDETSNHQIFSATGTSNSSVMLIPPSQMQSSQKSSCVQELFQKKSKKIQKIVDIAVEDNLQSKRPIQFQNMSNEFEIAYWLAHHKRILDLAINIQNGMMTGTDEEYETTSTSTSSSHALAKLSFESVSTTPIVIDQHVRYQLQEECKALFLRTRNNTTELYEELIVRVCKISKTDARLGSLVKDVDGWFNTYRYKFHMSVVKLVNEFKTVYERVEEPYDELKEFLTDDVWKQLLQLHLKATDLVKLRKDITIITNLGVFVHQVVKNVLIAQNDKEDELNL